jgi:hypothetical protein
MVFFLLSLIELPELEAMIRKKSLEYPQLSFYNDKILHLYNKSDISKDGKLDLDEFKTVKIDYCKS